MPRSIDLSGKTALIAGVANQRSLAWAIAEALSGAGCRLAFTYQGERLRENVEELAAKLDGTLVVPCDVTRDEDLDAAFGAIGEAFGGLDVFVHSVAFARKDELENDYRATSREGWRIALEISAYSFVAMSDRAARLMEPRGGGSIVTLTFQASERVFPSYNVMGSAKAALEHAVRQLAYELGAKNVRVNAISAGPISTLSARGISGFTDMLSHHREVAPLKRAIEPREVGDTALFLCSDLSTGITGTTIYVDTGYHVMGV